MGHMNVTIFLENSVDAFNINEFNLNQLSSTFPMWRFCKASNKEHFLTLLPETDIVITWEFKNDWYRVSKTLKAICTPSASHEWIERNADCTVPVFHGTFHGTLMAESLLSMMLYFNRQLRKIIVNQKNHVWDRNNLSQTHRLGSQNIVIVGYGKIGRECARILKAFGCRITGVKHSPYNPILDRDTDVICHPDDIKMVLGNCDHLVSILPGIKSNDHFFNREIFSSLKYGCFYYNIGRGNSYLEKDIIWALGKGYISGAGLDVFPNEPLGTDSVLWDHPDVFIMPHGSAIFQEYMSLYVNELAEIFKAFVT